jgi:hypothetical protein
MELQIRMTHRGRTAGILKRKINFLKKAPYYATCTINRVTYYLENKLTGELLHAGSERWEYKNAILTII